jgi:protein required for attachment to host cells
MWIVVASASEARVFNTTGSKQPLEELKDILHSESRNKVSELVSDQPGKQNGSDPSGAHSVNEKSDIKAHERDVFTRELCEMLVANHKRDRFRRLYLVAPSQVLGALHKHLQKHKNISDAVVGEFDLQLVKASPEEIRRHLPEYL